MNEQHEENLRRMLQQVGAGDLSTRTPGDTLESLSTRGAMGGLESVGPGSLAQQEMLFAQESVDAFVAGSEFDGDNRFALEAIVLPYKRPVIDVADNKLDTSQLTGQWSTLASDPSKRSTIENALLSVGRIEVPNHMHVPYAGTGFVVGENLIMTNRHVAKIFADGVGMRNLKFISGQTSKVDFLQEAKSDQVDSVDVEEVVMVHPYWDMAILKVRGLSANRKPLPLSLTDPSSIINEDVVTVGYPGFTPSTDQEFLRVQSRVFRDLYYVKRVQPGQLKKFEEVESYEKYVNAVTHDCSTLGGNSGSAVIELATGNVVGLHFAGAYLYANYAVPACELARDSRVVDAGVQFASAPNPQAGIYEQYWDEADSDGASTERSSRPPVDSGSQLPNAGGTSSNIDIQSGGESGVSITVPLVIRVDVGTPYYSGSVAGSASSGGVEVQRKRISNEWLFGPPAKEFSRFELRDLFDARSLTKESFRMSTALSLATLSKFAYEEKTVIESFGLGGFGFQSCKFVEDSDTQCFVSMTEDAAVVCFRGTESIGDWLLNLQVLTTVEPTIGSVHTGFLRGFKFVQAELESELRNLGNRKVLLTGHSLGGALASVAAAMWFGKYPISGVYTYGQPGVGLADFASFVNRKYDGKFNRFVNNSDAVTKVPPGLTHVGRLIHFDKRGSLKVNQESLSAESSGMMTKTQFEELKMRIERAASPSNRESGAVAQESLFTSFSDHSMDRYIEKIQKNL